jgi:hypothetical protein
VELGFMFEHTMLSSVARHAMTAEATAAVLKRLLVEAGVVSEEAVDHLVEEHVTQAAERETQRGLALVVNERDADKYVLDDLPEIDCANRVELCHAACCTLRFPLTRQDVEEGVIRFDLGQPYFNRVDESGYCVHFDRGGGCCSVYEQRPAPCRRFDCRHDNRIWLDFEGRVPNPNLARRAEARGLAVKPEG